MERRSWGRFYSSKEQDNNGIEFPLLPNLEGCFDWASEENRQVKSPFLDVEGPLRHRETRHRKSETMGKVPQVWASRISKDNSDCTGKKSPNRGQSEARNECVIWFALFKTFFRKVVLTFGVQVLALEWHKRPMQFFNGCLQEAKYLPTNWALKSDWLNETRCWWYLKQSNFVKRGMMPLD